MLKLGEINLKAIVYLQKNKINVYFHIFMRKI